MTVDSRGAVAAARATRTAQRRPAAAAQGATQGAAAPRSSTPVPPNARWLAHHDFAALRRRGDPIDEGLNPRGLKAAIRALRPVVVLALVLRLRGRRSRRYVCLCRGRCRRSCRSRRISRCSWPGASRKGDSLLSCRCRHRRCVSRAWRAPRPGGTPSCVAPSQIRGCCRPGRRRLPDLIFLDANVKNAGRKLLGPKTLSTALEQRRHARYGAPLRHAGGPPLSHGPTFYVPRNPRRLVTWTNAARPTVYTHDIDAGRCLARGRAARRRVGAPDVRCANTDFTAWLTARPKRWPSPTVDATEDVLFSFHGKVGQQRKPLCVARGAPFEAPAAHGIACGTPAQRKCARAACVPRRAIEAPAASHPALLWARFRGEPR